MPMSLVIMWLSWPVFVMALERHEVSTNTGGLILWPARLLVPIGFFLLIIQGISELIKRVAFLKGLIPDPAQGIATRQNARASLAPSVRAASSRRGSTAANASWAWRR